MTSDRAYRRAMPHEIAMAEVGRCAKAQFDPQCVDAFEKGIAEFRQEKVDSGQEVPE
jgi:HD-GYP domain-containing protein (c-di-GMP phosphodiesterase class II)